MAARFFGFELLCEFGRLALSRAELRVVALHDFTLRMGLGHSEFRQTYRALTHRDHARCCLQLRFQPPHLTLQTRSATRPGARARCRARALRRRGSRPPSGVAAAHSMLRQPSPTLASALHFAAGGGESNHPPPAQRRSRCVRTAAMGYGVSRMPRTYPARHCLQYRRARVLGCARSSSPPVGASRWLAEPCRPIYSA